MIALLIKSSLVLIILLAFYKIFLEKESFFGVNRIYLLGCLVFAFTLPFIPLPQLVKNQGIVSTLLEKNNLNKESVSPDEIVLTKNNLSAGQVGNTSTKVEQPQKEVFSKKEKQQNKEVIPSKKIATNEEVLPVQDVKTKTNKSSNSERGTAYWLMLIYFFGVGVLTLNLVTQVAGTLLKALKNDDKIEDDDGIIINMAAVSEPCSFFKYIFIHPPSYDFDTYEQIIAHEKIHVKKMHSLDLLLAELAVVLLWFNPFVWIFRKEVEKNIEYQTDDILVNGEAKEREGYQMNLLKIATYNKPLAITTNYNQSLIKQRILKMNGKKSNAYSYWKYAFIAPVLFVTLLILNKPLALQAMNETTFENVMDKNKEPISDSNNNLTLEENERTSDVKEKNTETVLDKKEKAIVKIEKEKVQEYINGIEPAYGCEDLEKAILDGNVEKVKMLINDLPKECLENMDEKSLANLDFLKSVLSNKNVKMQIFTDESELSPELQQLVDEALQVQNDKVVQLSNHEDCDGLQKAAKEKDLEKVKRILMNYKPACLTSKTQDQKDNIALIQRMVNRDAEIFMEAETGNITIKGFTTRIWSDDSHKAYKQAHNAENIFNPIAHDELDKAINSSNELAAINIIRNLNPKYLVNQDERSYAHLKYMKYILNNGGKLTIDYSTVYIKHDDSDMFYSSSGHDFDNDIKITNSNNFPGKECKSFIKAVRTNDISKVKELLNTVDVNCIDPNPEYEEKVVNGDRWFSQVPQTPLVAALRIRNFEIAKILIDAGADVNFHQSGDETPLMAAATHGNIDFVKLLLEQGANLRKMTEGYGTALHCAAREGHVELVNYFLEKGSRINAANDGQGTPLNGAARNGQLEVVKLLLAKGVDINFQNDGQGSALNAAARHGHTEIVNLLLEKGAKINIQNDGQGGALNAAARHGNITTAKLLLERGANINAQNDGQGSALNAAARHGHIEMVKLLLDKGANIDAQTDGQGSALNAAARHGHIEMVEFLLSKGADINVQNDGQGSALNAAARHGYLGVVKLLVEKGARINARTSGQGSALEAAERHRHPEIVDYLISKGAVKY